MKKNTLGNQSVTIFIVFLIPLLVISNLSLLIADQVNASQEEFPFMLNDYSVAGIPLANLTKEEAFESIEQAIEGVDTQELVITIDENQWSISVADLNVNYDVQATVDEAFSLTGYSSRQNIPLVFQYDRQKLQELLLEIGEEVDVPMVNARLFKVGNMIHQSPEQVGQVLNIENAILTIHTALANGLPSNHFILYLTKVVPTVSDKDIREIDKHFVTYSTKVSPDDMNRIHNIEQAIQFMSGFIVKPQEMFSFNQTAGPYTEGNGYIVAPVFSEGDITEGFGGGVCQVSTTLFVASMKGGLQLEEHHHHVRPVQYVPVGFDATVDNEDSDLKLINPKRRNIYISINYNDFEIQVDVFGNQADFTKYSLETRNLRETNPPTVYHLDQTISPYSERVMEQGQKGYQVDLYRTWNSGNEKLEERISRFNYEPVPKVIGVGEKHRKANETPEGKNLFDNQSGQKGNNTKAQLG